jgi:putative transposase
VKKRFTDEQIIRLLKQVEGWMPIKKLCRNHGFTDTTFYN